MRGVQCVVRYQQGSALLYSFNASLFEPISLHKLQSNKFNLTNLDLRTFCRPGALRRYSKWCGPSDISGLDVGMMELDHVI